MRICSRDVFGVLAGSAIVVGLAANAWAQAGFVKAGLGAAADESQQVSAAVGTNQDLAESILAQREAESGRRFDPRYRAGLKSRLAALDQGRLESLAQAADSPVNLKGLLTRNALGDSSADLVYTPVPPCRVFDTRHAAAGILVGGTQRNFIVTGTTGFPDQGGNTGGCGIPVGPATSVIINFAAVTPTGSGNLRAWAVATPQPAAPTAAVMNFSPALAALANGIAVPICDAAATACTSDLRLQADASSVHVVGDVVGYFSTTGEVLPGGTLPTGSTLRGNWGMGWTADAAGEFQEAFLAFGFTLASAPVAHFIALGATPPAACPGTSADPQADPGHLCVYENNTGNTTGKSVCSSFACPAASPWGAQIIGDSAAAGDAWARGTWAVTAP